MTTDNTLDLPGDASPGLESPVNAPPTPEKINDLRERVLKGETISTQEYHYVIQSLRTRRLDDSNKAAEKAAPRVAKRAAAKPNQSLDDLLGELNIGGSK